MINMVILLKVQCGVYKKHFSSDPSYALPNHIFVYGLLVIITELIVPLT